MNINTISAIDSHTHINHHSPYDSVQTELSCSMLPDLEKYNQAANIGKMCCSTFASVLNASVIPEENAYLYELCTHYDWLYQWVVVDPRIPQTLEQVKRMLQSSKCVGIKLHPLYHKYALEQYGDKIFTLASDYNAIVQIHPKKDVTYILPFANKYPNITFIMAHLGNETYVDAIEQAKYQNVYTDTSGIASSQNHVIEYAVSRIGSEHILFGTDTYAAGFQRGRIEYALISEKDKENILCLNAKRLFNF